MAAVLGLAWFVGAVVWPVIETRKVVENYQGVRGYDIVPGVYEKALETLGGASRAAPRLGLYLRLPERWAPHRQNAWRMLEYCGKEARQQKVLLLSHREPGVRWEAARRLYDDPRAVETLIQLLAEEDLKLCRAAVESLKYRNDHRMIGPLIELFRRNDANESTYASQEMWAEVRSTLVSAGPLAIKPLVAVLGDDGVNDGAAFTLIKIGKPAVPQLITALEDPEAKVRSMAVWTLGNIKDSAAVEALIRRLRDAASDVRWRSAEALGDIGDLRAVKPLSAVLTDKEWMVRCYAAKALGQIGSAPPEAFPILESLKKDKRLEVRRAAYQAWVNIRGKAP
jgi:HEAT repeat protein